jgi:RNA polymerase sigma-70 factor (ECF subfamily)
VEDDSLLERFLEGDGDALESLIKRYEKPLYAYLARVTGDRHLAEDVFQETFLRVAKEAARFDRKRKFKPWLYSIATRLAIDGLRKKTVRSEVPLEAPEGGAGLVEGIAGGARGPLEEAEKKEEVERLHEAMARLTEVERAVALMHFREGLTLLEISEALDIPLGTVKSRLHAALVRLAGLMRQGGGGTRS